MLMRRADPVPHLPKYFRQVADVVLCQHATTRFGHEDQLGVQSANDAPATPVVTTSCHRRMACSDAVLVRYRYRLRPVAWAAASSWRGRLAAPGWCSTTRLRLREECHAAGEKISDTEVQRRVITLAKLTPGAGVAGHRAPSVALVQASDDARRAYRNYFDSRSGKRKGRRKSAIPGSGPKARTAVHQAHPQRVLPARARGCMWRRWARSRSAGPGGCPAEPSSVTVIRKPDGRYYASFVVERAPAPLPDW